MLKMVSITLKAKLHSSIDVDWFSDYFRWSVVHQVSSTIVHTSCIFSGYCFRISCMQYIRHQKCRGFRSGLQLGHVTGALREIKRPWNLACNISMFAVVQWEVAPSCWNHHCLLVDLYLIQEKTRSLNILPYEFPLTLVASPFSSLNQYTLKNSQ